MDRKPFDTRPHRQRDIKFLTDFRSEVPEEAQPIETGPLEVPVRRQIKTLIDGSVLHRAAMRI